MLIPYLENYLNLIVILCLICIMFILNMFILGYIYQGIIWSISLSLIMIMLSLYIFCESYASMISPSHPDEDMILYIA
jgi:Co/Zn/Cd efflux system component